MTQSSHQNNSDDEYIEEKEDDFDVDEYEEDDFEEEEDDFDTEEKESG